SDLAYQPPLSDRALNRALFSSLFILLFGPSKEKSSEREFGEGYLVGQKRNLITIWKSWLYYLVKYAIARKLLKTDLSNVTPQHLVNIWPKLFPCPMEIVVAEYLNSENLLQWLKTSQEASRALHNAISTYPQEVLEVQ